MIWSIYYHVKKYINVLYIRHSLYKYSLLFLIQQMLPIFLKNKRGEYDEVYIISKEGRIGHFKWFSLCMYSINTICIFITFYKEIYDFIRSWRDVWIEPPRCEIVCTYCLHNTKFYTLGERSIPRTCNMLVLLVRFHVTVQEHTIGVRRFVRETVGLNGESSHVIHKRKCY